ncbi:MAG: HU family DNA-binding protein [Deltaproteobacteria bacterium]|nr:HU family DNA-binding protein [Deltaproteobacteria bacterium]
MAEKKPMTKTQIVKTLSEQLDLPKKQVNQFLETFTNLAVKETKKVGSFTIPGIGKLVKAKRKARMGMNPATGEKIRIPAKTVVKMRLSKVCKDAIVPPKKK